MLLLNHHAAAKIKRHGLSVYPLDGFGILLGETIAEDAVLAWAALPVGKTTCWYNLAGRFADIEQALKLATETFASWALYPVGVYSTVANTLEQSATQSQFDNQTHRLLVCSTDGGEITFAPRSFLWQSDTWVGEANRSVAPRIDQPSRNPNRMTTAWNRAWGVLDYSNNPEKQAR